jgi:Protein of unknown function (DUF4058)
MPVHDWTRVTAGTFHDFHNAWITELRNALNGGVLPAGYYALGEQRSGDVSPDVLTLHSEAPSPHQTSAAASDHTGMIAVAEQPPNVSLALEAATDAAFYIAKRRTLVIYQTTGDRIVAFIEILSPGNKHSQHTIDDFLDKVVAALRAGYHVLVLDLFPPGRCDPSGIHGVIWEYLTSEAWQFRPDRPLTLASYCAKVPITAYVEPISVGRTLPEMPLFLTPDHYIYVPLEQTYMAAWRGVPQRWRHVIEPDSVPRP